MQLFEKRNLTKMNNEVSNTILMLDTSCIEVKIILPRFSYYRDLLDFLTNDNKRNIFCKRFGYKYSVSLVGWSKFKSIA